MFNLFLIATVIGVIILFCHYASSPSTAITTRDIYYPSALRPYSPARPNGRGMGRVFTVEISEGEVCELDTSDCSSPFYGSAWTRVLTARENGEFLRGTVRTCLVSRDGRFSDYTVNVEGLNAFLPVSKAAWFYHPAHDAYGKAIAVGIEQVYANGKKIGNIVVSAYAPIRHLARRQSKKDYMPGAKPYAIAMDHDGASLIFPQYGDRAILAPLAEAVGIASSKGIDSRPDALTGYCWQLRILGWKGDMGSASLLDVLND